MGRDIHKLGTSARSGLSLAKLSLPRLAQGIARPRLFALLDGARQGSGTWIAAPGGAGKTTLAATYLIERGLPYLWYQLDKDDADPATFFYYLGIAARQLSPDLHLPLLTPEYLPDIPGFARRYFRDLFARLPRDLVLVLDNYQDLGEVPLFAQMLRNALEEIRGAHLMVLSRSGPPWANPPAGTLACLGWETLRLTYDETRAIVAHGHALDEASLHALHRRADGWPAGVTLLLEQIEGAGSGAAALDAGATDTVFHFFAGEFFNQLPDATQDFLLKTALLAHMTPSMAERLSGNREAAHILADLHRRHFFVHRRDLDEISYQYHALFREFLMDRMTACLSDEDRLNLVRGAGVVLCEHDREEEAIGLYLRSKEWGAAIPLVLGQAQQLLAQGRSQIVAGWIQRLPEPLVSSIPWLLYWKGVAQMATHPFEAQEILKLAFAGFEVESDVVGKLVSASAIIDITYFFRQSLRSSEKWLMVIQDEFGLEPRFPSPVVEGRVLASLFSVLIYMQPTNVNLPVYAGRLVALLVSELDVNQRVLICAQLVHYYALVQGDMAACERIIEHISPFLPSPDLTSFNKYLWHSLSSVYFCIGHVKAAGREAVAQMMAIIEANNFSLLRSITYLYSYYIYYSLGDIAEAREMLSLLKEVEARLQPADLAWEKLATAHDALIRGDQGSALSYGKQALDLTSHVGAFLVEMEIDCLLSAACLEKGDVEDALAYIDLPKKADFGNSPRIRSRASQTEAYIHLLQGEVEKCHFHLRRGFSIAAKEGYLGDWVTWNRRMMTRLCAEAWKADIEVEYVRRMIRAHGFVPETPGEKDWPWIVKVYTLGRFRLEIHSAEIGQSQFQGKPHALLSALISLGSKEVKVERIAELLWPDAEGDAALSSFTTTLSRLRKMIGDEIIVVQGGRVTLDERQCWLDVRALEYYLRQVDEADKSDAAALWEWVEEIFRLYRGPYMQNEKWEWVEPLRHRLREELVRVMERCDGLLRKRTARQATYLLKRLIKVDQAVHSVK